jgi:uncharacterized protein (TIGR03000 family)
MPPANDTTFVTYGPSPAPMVKPIPASLRGNMAPVQLEILVPDADAQVWVEGVLTRTKGMQRIFATPDLEKGYTYSYTVRVAWLQSGQQVTSERQVQVIPGVSKTIDFTGPDLPPPSFGQ